MQRASRTAALRTGRLVLFSLGLGTRRPSEFIAQVLFGDADRLRFPLRFGEVQRGLLDEELVHVWLKFMG